MKKYIYIKNIKLQSGLSLVVTLIMLASMMMMSVGFYLLADSTNSVANSIALKQASMHAAEKGIDEAAKWLEANKTSLTTHNTAAGYYASSPDIVTDSTAATFVIDYTGFITPNVATDNVLWEGGNTSLYSAKKYATKVGGFDIAYVIHRLCSGPGVFNTTNAISCATTGVAANESGAFAEGSEYGSYKISEKTRIIYRITARALGPNRASTLLQSKVVIEY